MRVALGLALIAAVLAACAGRRLPPGTPPPEYEQPIVSAWPPEIGDAGSDAAAPAVPDAIETPRSSGAEPALSLDAGAR